MFRKLFMAVPIAVLVIGGSTACATKKFVRTSVGEVNDKVDSLGRSVEETQERTRQNEGRIAEVDQKAQAAAQSAQQANDAASRGATPPAAVGEQRGQRGRRQGSTRSTRPTSALVYEVVLSEDQGNFKFGKTSCPTRPRRKLDQMVDAAQGGSEGRLLRDRRPHRQRRRQDDQREASGSSAPRP